MSITSKTRRASFEVIKPTSAARCKVIMGILGDRQMTALEIAQQLYAQGYTPKVERNFAAPRLTELKKAGKVKAVGKRYCPETGRNVAVWACIKEV